MPESIDAWSHRCLQSPFHPQHQHQPTAKKKALHNRPPTNNQDKELTHDKQAHNRTIQATFIQHPSPPTAAATYGIMDFDFWDESPSQWSQKNLYHQLLCCRQWLWRGAKENRREESRAFTSSSKFYQARPLKTQIKGLSDHEL
jgi:hypothetical protein